MTSKETQKELQRINQLTSEEREFVKSTFLYDYLVLVAHKGTIDPKGYLDNSEF